MEIEVGGVEYPIRLFCKKCGKKLIGIYSLEVNAIMVEGCIECMFEYIGRDPKKTGV